MFKKAINKIKSVYMSLAENNFTTIAASWSFFLLSAIVPLIFLLIVAFSVFGVDISGLIGDNFSSKLEEIISYLVEIAGKGVKGATIFFILTIFYSASSLFSHMIKDCELIFFKKRTRNGLLRRVFSFLVLFVVFLAFFILAGALVVNSKLVAFFPKGKFYGLLTKILINLIVFLFIYGIIILINILISPIKLKPSYLLLTALFSTAVIVLGSLAFAVYTHYFSSYENLYGNLSAVIIFILWIYILMLGIVIGIILNKILNQGES